MTRVIVLEGKPQSTNHLYKPTVRGIYLTQEGKDLKEDYAWQAKAQWKREPLTQQNLLVDIHLYFPDKRRRDWDNWHKLSMDALTGIVYEDDSQILAATVSKHIDKERPRIEIKVQWSP